VIAGFHPGELWLSAPDQELVALLDEAAKQAVELQELREGRRFDFGRAGVEVLAPPPVNRRPAPVKLTTR